MSICNKEVYNNLPYADFPIESTDEISTPDFLSNHGKKSLSYSSSMECNTWQKSHKLISK